MRCEIGHMGTQLGWVLAVFALSSTSAVADNAMAEAAALREQGQHQAAFELLDRGEAHNAGDFAYDMALGDAAFAAGHYTHSILAYERAYIAQPEHAAARAALARSLQAVGDVAGAQALITSPPVSFSNPLNAWNQSQQFSTFDRPQFNGLASFKGHVEAGFGHDSNANAGPTGMGLSGTLPGGGGTWQLPATAGARAASHATVGTAVSGRWMLDPTWSLNGQLTADSRWYADAAKAFDAQQSDALGGISYLRDRHQFGLSGLLGQYRQNHLVARNTSGIQADWVYKLDGFRQWSTFVQDLAVSYPAQPQQDTRRQVLGTTYMQVFRTGASAFAGIYGGHEKAANGFEHFGHRLVGVRLGGEWPINPQWSLFSNVGHEERTYAANDPLFGLRRTDQQINATLGLSWVPAPEWRVTPQVVVTRNTSTLAASEYLRRQTSIVVRRSF